jgi:BlaI family transcriptional regulator, penicillinase repressor
MKKRKPTIPKPTEAELKILHVLWVRGAGTVREIHNLLLDQQDTRYSTTLKMLQVMHGKGLVLRDDSQRPQVYRAARSRNQTQIQLMDDLVHRAFGGAANKLLVQALSAKRVSAEELAEIKQLIERLEKEST